MHELAAWILFPLIALAILFGIGTLAARLARADVPAATVPALGLAAAIVVLGPLYATGVGGVAGSVLLAVLALGGFALGRREANPDARLAAHLRPRFGALAGIATYALHITPVALTGTATFLGYNLLNDTAIHLALVDWIGEHGSRFVEEPASSYAAAIDTYVGNRYPLGSHELLAALKPFVGMDPAAIYQPFLALCAAVAAAAIFGVVRIDRRAAAAIAFAAMASQLVFSFALQGSIKELAFIACLAAAAGVARSPALVAICAASLYSIYGLAALAWIAPLALVVLIATRPGRRGALVGIGVFLVAVAVYVPDSIEYYRHGSSVLRSGEELGPLAGPLKLVQVSGVWLNGDYRFSPDHSWITYALAIALLALALVGARRVLLFLLPALVAFALTAPMSSPYIDAKLLAILSPAVIAAAGLGIASIPRRRVAIAAAAVAAGALLISDALAYRMALPAPTARLGELADIDDRYAGQGPLLVNEFEEYVKHYMRDSRGSNPYESWTAGRAQLRDPKLKVTGHRYDLDQMTDRFVQRWKLIVLRRSPVESRPPSNFDRVWRGDYYEVWRRSRPAPKRHIPLGKWPFAPVAGLDCKQIAALNRGGEVVAALRPAPVAIRVSTARPLPAGWYVYGQDRRMLEIHKGGALSIPTVALRDADLWLRGRTTRRARIGDNDVQPSLQRIAEWIRVGDVTAKDALSLTRPKRSLRPGDAQPDIVGPLVAVPKGEPLLVRGAQLEEACGAPADWIDVIR